MRDVKSPQPGARGPTLSSVRMRLQKLDDSDGALGRLRVVLQATPGEAWSCEEINQSQLPALELRAGLEDLRDQAELSQQA